MHPDLKKKISFYEWEKANFPGDEVFWEALSREARRLTVPLGNVIFLRDGALFGGTSCGHVSPQGICISPTLTGTRTPCCAYTCSSTQQTFLGSSCRCQI